MDSVMFVGPSAGLPFCQPVYRGYGGLFLEGAL